MVKIVITFLMNYFLKECLGMRHANAA